MLLETYTTLSAEELRTRLPGFLKLGPEVTGEPAFSMYNLTLKAGWIDNDNFCHHLSEEKAHNETQEGMINKKSSSLVLRMKHTKLRPLLIINNEVFI